MAAALARRHRAHQQAACQGKKLMHVWEQSLALLTSANTLAGECAQVCKQQ